MKRLVAVVLVSGMLAGCGGAKQEAASEATEVPEVSAADSDNAAADMPPPPPAPGQGAPAPEPMNAPAADMAEPGAEPDVDRGLPVCPGDPRCKRK